MSRQVTIVTFVDSTQRDLNYPAQLLHMLLRPLSSKSFARSMSSYTRLVRFVPRASDSPLIGEPVDPKQDVGLAYYRGEPIEVRVFSGTSIISPGEYTGETKKLEKLLSPLAQAETGTIRCIGTNVSPTRRLVLIISTGTMQKR